ncbi:FHA domain-containing protein [Ornithinicoccus hortensis]|uniref:Type III secretion system (T3SS) inner membrane Yop/YscD-like protein n=2 Tax=Ornithinicoccus hortensis TaxID=82346 RepID=A0A542YT49_9MICO|nr:FHA domain-containing protein [Ornithinicoccus hortensis]TQL51272.1 type III secretion system (T3SS) inner membrane Yop/YscD-like protein [Ornithinicoccus hortensis]
MTDREREHHDPGMDPTTARIPLGTDVPALEHSFEDEPPRLSTEDQRTVEALRPGTALLIVLRGPNTGARFLLDAEEVSSGRHPDSDIFLDDVTVSRRHAVFAREGEGYQVRDVGSLNGTYVNRERIDQATLEAGDEVQIGKFRLVYYLGRQ